MERRLSPRLSLELPVEQTLADVPTARARTLDLSADGICLAPEAGETLTEGRFAWVRFSLPTLVAGASAEPVIRALVELCERDAERARYRIKYIYPRDRRRFEAFVAQATGTC